MGDDARPVAVVAVPARHCCYCHVGPLTCGNSRALTSWAAAAFLADAATPRTGAADAPPLDLLYTCQNTACKNRKRGHEATGHELSERACQRHIEATLLLLHSQPQPQPQRLSPPPPPPPPPPPSQLQPVVVTRRPVVVATVRAERPMLATPRTGAAAAAGLGLNGAGYLEIKGSVLMEQELPHWKQAEAYEPREEVFDGLDSSGKPTTKTASVGGTSRVPPTPMAFRLQGPASGKAALAWQTGLGVLITNHLHQEHGLMLDSTGVAKPYRPPQRMRSLPGGPEQPKHADSAAHGHLRGMDWRNIPLVVLYALQDNTTVKVWRYDTHAETTLVLMRGDMVVMRGDLAHCGTSYSVQNDRLHVYIDSRWVSCDGDARILTEPTAAGRKQPSPNVTFLCHGSEEVGALRCTCHMGHQ